MATSLILPRSQAFITGINIKKLPEMDSITIFPELMGGITSK
jgi:hypothetical protein